MARSMVLAYWEIRRMRRSRATWAVLLVVPAAGVIGHVLLRGTTQDAALRLYFPAAAVLFTWVMFYARSLADRASGYAAGTDSTPAAGAIAVLARLVTIFIVAALQAAIFHLAVRVVG